MSLVAVVTGASGGIGSAVANRLSGVADYLVLCGRRIESLEQVEPSGGAVVRRLGVDVTSSTDVARIGSETRSLHAERLVLVNAAGTFGPVDAAGTADIEGWDETLRTHVLGALAAAVELMPLMTEKGWGRVINVSSAQSLHGPDPSAGAYATAKAAVNVMTAGIAAQFEGSDISVCAIHPGDVNTAMASDIREKSARAGESAVHLAQWGAVIGAGGGDDAASAGELVAEIIERPAVWSNGRFLLVPSSADRHPKSGWSMPVGPSQGGAGIS